MDLFHGFLVYPSYYMHCRKIHTLTIALTLVILLFPKNNAYALTSGTLVKGSKPDIYYISSSGKKIAFSDEQTFFTWYTDFSKVQIVSDSVLNKIPSGGFATIRPGTKMVKVRGVNKVYAVSRGEILRWVKTEAAAKAIYGNTWNKQIINLTTPQFQNYRLGEEITNGTQFSSQAELSAVPNINTELSLALSVRGFTP